MYLCYPIYFSVCLKLFIIKKFYIITNFKIMPSYLTKGPSYPFST